MRLNKKKKYLQVAFNRSMEEVRQMVGLLPPSDSIIVEAGTPFIKQYGTEGIAVLRDWWFAKLGHPGYIVADLKCMDRGFTEVQAASRAGASAATCLGLAPLETIAEFIKHCHLLDIDSMVDMMNVEFPFEILQHLREKPDIVVLHRGVDENEQNKDKMLPHHLINQIKGTYLMSVSIAGGESLRDVQRTFFNNADIAVVWKSLYSNPQATTELVEQFLLKVK